VTINRNDQVKWVWVGAYSHTSTSSLWNSGIHGSGYSFMYTFTSSGTFPYDCSLHAVSYNMKGTITVRAPTNVPPTATITAPASGAVFAAPWTGQIHGMAADSDGSVTKVDFYDGAALLGTISTPPANFSFTVTNLAAGAHSLKAVSTDNGGATGTSATVSINVVTPKAVVSSAPRQPSPGAFQFSYTANAGLRYVVRWSADLKNWTPISTNTAAGNTVTFLDNQATATFRAYSVQLLPNP
jgi:hypothetical protein